MNNLNGTYWSSNNLDSRRSRRPTKRLQEYASQEDAKRKPRSSIPSEKRTKSPEHSEKKVVKQTGPARSKTTPPKTEADRQPNGKEVDKASIPNSRKNESTENDTSVGLVGLGSETLQSPPVDNGTTDTGDSRSIKTILRPDSQEAEFFDLGLSVTTNTVEVPRDDQKGLASPKTDFLPIGAPQHHTTITADNSGTTETGHSLAITTVVRPIPQEVELFDLGLSVTTKNVEIARNDQEGLASTETDFLSTGSNSTKPTGAFDSVGAEPAGPRVTVTTKNVEIAQYDQKGSASSKTDILSTGASQNTNVTADNTRTTTSEHNGSLSAATRLTPLDVVSSDSGFSTGNELSPISNNSEPTSAFCFVGAEPADPKVAVTTKKVEISRNDQKGLASTKTDILSTGAPHLTNIRADNTRTITSEHDGSLSAVTRLTPLDVVFSESESSTGNELSPISNSNKPTGALDFVEAGPADPRVAMTTENLGIQRNDQKELELVKTDFLPTGTQQRNTNGTVSANGIWMPVFDDNGDIVEQHGAAFNTGLIPVRMGAWNPNSSDSDGWMPSFDDQGNVRNMRVLPIGFKSLVPVPPTEWPHLIKPTVDYCSNVHDANHYLREQANAINMANNYVMRARFENEQLAAHVSILKQKIEEKRLESHQIYDEFNAINKKYDKLKSTSDTMEFFKCGPGTSKN